MSDSGSMTDVEKAKDTFSIHQDNLVWSRTQTLIAVQGGILAGGFAVHGILVLAVPLIVLGILLTGILWWIAERDQTHRNEAFKQSGLERTRPRDQINGTVLIRIAFALLLVADLWLLAWIYFGQENTPPNAPRTPTSQNQRSD